MAGSGCSGNRASRGGFNLVVSVRAGLSCEANGIEEDRELVSVCDRDSGSDERWIVGREDRQCDKHPGD